MNDDKYIFSEYPDVVTPEDVQNMLHMGRNSVYKLLKEEKIKTLKIGKKYIIPKKSVIRFIDINT